MKKLLLLLFFTPLLLWSQSTVNVTFQVDMSEYTGAYTTVNVNGTFNSWCGGCAVMTDANNDSIYELVVAVPSGTLIEWKFTIDGWTGQEMFVGGEPCTMTTGGNTNRFGTFSADAVLPVACWNSCSACGVYTPTACGDLIISEYIEGSGSNKALELYNPTANPIDLSLYSVYCNVNAGTFNNLTSPQGTIPAYGTYVMVNSSADSVLTALADTLLSGFSAVNFNGDDAILLVKGTDTLDLIGIVDNDPGSSWPVGSGSTANHTLVRSASVDMGSTDWAVGATQWDVYPSDTYTEIGSHSNVCSPSDVTFKVDMSQYTGTYGTVNLNGTFNNWCGGCAVMVDPDGDLIYEVTVTDIPNGIIEFKYTVDDWTGQENLTPGMSCVLTTGAFTNRSFTVAGDTTLSPVCWESCAACVVSNPCVVSTLPYTEDFEMGFPACWDTTQNAGSNGFQWGDVTTQASSFWPVPAHTNFMASNDDACDCDMSNDLLRSPQFDLTAYSGSPLELSFEYYGDQNYGSVATVWYSMNGGPLMLLDSLPASPAAAWVADTLDVSAVAGSDSVVFVFKHDDQGFWADGVAIDDVALVEGVNPCVISSLPYTEDFEAGFPACWDTTQNAGSNGFQWGDVTTQASSFWPVPAHTNFMASNDDACDCDMSNDLLRSPQFDLSGYSGSLLDLSFEYYGDQNYGSVATVWYSMNGGALMLLDSIPASPAAAWAAYTVDASATAGSDSVVFVFKHDDQGFWADGVAIDDVSLDVAPDPCVVSTLPYTEDFELGLPACWDTTHNAGSNGFQWGDSTALASSFWPVPAHTNFMASNDDACDCDMSNDLLRTNQFDLTGYSGQGLLLSFEYYGDQNYGSVGTVWYSMNGGSLTLLDSLPPSPATAWAAHTIDVSAVAGSDSVVFVFKHDDQGLWADGVAIDDVSLDVGALTSNVTFQVDMNASGATFGYVNVSGNFNNWCGDCAQMTDANNDGVWELTINDIPNGPIEFKYSLDNWTADESLTPGASCVITAGGFTNRYLDVQGDTTMPVVCYTSCSACPSNPIDVNVTFQVDMDGYTGTYTDVNLNGTFNGWCGGCATMTDLDGDNVYELTVLFPNITVGDTIEWKFTVDGWTDQESLTPGDPCVMTTDGFTNRMTTLTGVDTTIDVVCWNSCDACPSIGIEEEGFGFNLYPNPTKDQVTLLSNVQEEQTIRIIDAQGRLVQVLTTTANQNEVVIDLSGLTAGWYTVTVESDSFYNVKKLVIQE